MLLDAVDLFEKHLYQNFVQNKMRMEDFSGLILNSGESALSSNIHATVDKIYTELDAPLRQLIETMRAAVYDAYLGIFDYFLQLQQYMGQAVDFTEDARRMKIWLKPVSVLKQLQSSSCSFSLVCMRFHRYVKSKAIWVRYKMFWCFLVTTNWE